MFIYSIQIGGAIDPSSGSSKSKTTTNTSLLAMIGGICGAIVIEVVIIVILAYWCLSLKNGNTSKWPCVLIGR